MRLIDFPLARPCSLTEDSGKPAMSMYAQRCGGRVCVTSGRGKDRQAEINIEKRWGKRAHLIAAPPGGAALPQLIWCMSCVIMAAKLVIIFIIARGL